MYCTMKSLCEGVFDACSDTQGTISAFWKSAKKIGKPRLCGTREYAHSASTWVGIFYRRQS